MSPSSPRMSPAISTMFSCSVNRCVNDAEEGAGMSLSCSLSMPETTWTPQFDKSNASSSATGSDPVHQGSFKPQGVDANLIIWSTGSRSPRVYHSPWRCS